MHDGKVAAEYKAARDRVCCHKFQYRQRRLEASSAAQKLLTKERPRPFSCPVQDTFARAEGNQTDANVSSNSSPDMMIMYSPVSYDNSQSSTFSLTCEPSSPRRISWAFSCGECSREGGGGTRSSSAASEVYGQRFADGAMASQSRAAQDNHGIADDSIVKRILASPPAKIPCLRQELLMGQCQALTKQAVRTRRFLEVGTRHSVALSLSP